MKEIKQTSAEEHKALIEEMSKFFEATDEPCVGIFWLNPKTMSLFGVQKDEAALYDNGKAQYTYPKLHKTYWQKQHHRAVTKNQTESVFFTEPDCTKVPRGRIWVRDNQFVVKVGNWIHKVNYDEFSDIVQDEFNLPDDFIIEEDPHWNIGCGWNQEQI